MAKKSIDQLIINSPFERPREYWKYDRETRLFNRESGRRPAGYVIATPGAKHFDDPGVFVELPLVNQVRERVDKWREEGYPGATGITKRLLEHWHDPNVREGKRFFFCQLEAAETLIWWTEAPPASKQGVNIPFDGGLFRRLCSKMATGSGKTTVMGMIIAWQILNKTTYPQKSEYSKYFLVVAPGLTVGRRLQVLVPDSENNTYEEFQIIPTGLLDKVRQGKVKVVNWHKLNWETEEQIAKKKSVDKRGAKSDEAYVREVLRGMPGASNIVVINDEAHHAWRVPAESKLKGVSRDELDEATKWIGGLDRIHRCRGILNSYDFTATPFMPTGKTSSDEALFDWVVSDFGLTDAIESGLVKTPRIVVRDDGKYGKDFKSRLYHIYMDAEVKDDFNRKAQEHEPLPDLVTNAYYLLGKDWLETLKAWEEVKFPTPPVMITVANRTETAARIKYAFDHKKVRVDELCLLDCILHIDSKVLAEAEAQEEPVSLNVASDEGEDDDNGDVVEKKLTKKQIAELLRLQVDTVGKVGKPGEKIRKVISVGMLSEGWDAKTVTHIMGLRAFSSQLLCEQVVGRGLRRTSYETNPATGMFDAEYVNIFGVPFTFLPHESVDGPPPPPPLPKTKIEPDPAKIEYEINWPNVIRIDYIYKPQLTLDISKVKVLKIDAFEKVTNAKMAPVLEGKPDLTRLSEIDLQELAKRFRFQKIIFETARDLFDQMQPDWKGNRELLLAQLIGLVEKVIRSDRIDIHPPLFGLDEMRRRILLTLNMNKLVQHIWDAIKCENTEELTPVLDDAKPIRSTGDMRTWYTGKPCEPTVKSHVNMCVYDSTWEATESFVMEENPHVTAWVKNDDHLGFAIYYVFDGIVKKFLPDFLIRLDNGTMLVLEVKGQDSPINQAKRKALDFWVKAVNEDGRFGKWASDVSFRPGDVVEVIARHIEQKNEEKCRSGEVE